MRSNLNMSSFNEAILFSGDSILIKEGCEIKKYKESDFSQKSSLLTPTIIRQLRLAVFKFLLPTNRNPWIRN